MAIEPQEVLRRAIVAVEEGSKKHGDTLRSFEMIAQMWGIHIAHVMARRKQVSLTPFDVATMMMMVKQARAVYGNSIDNQVDAAGYAALAAMLDESSVVEEDLANALSNELKTSSV